MEGFPTFLIVMNTCAITFPRLSAAAGLVWAVGRIWYQIGYGKYGPKGRGNGAHLAYVAQLVLVWQSLFPLCPVFLLVLLSPLYDDVFLWHLLGWSDCSSGVRFMDCARSLWVLPKGIGERDLEDDLPLSDERILEPRNCRSSFKELKIIDIRDLSSFHAISNFLASRFVSYSTVYR
jgi:hypothetical protein